ncbi:hypothetical protein CEUSTIGMA_g5154.t1 [Chlamydomonas eustigma]|uniref:DNA damage-inducible protein 1 n=1 Tax=Chlamydomonas eustigma TaxID=1157962 RepID=A0A250X3S2_9CHLO|nr:hypothetical protein CEUSTIGMA_g5154.t1 [Chlamydomonas eustigma]|eukprot:GAX77711.1 hypothetical protein CEUSTIGMA_g5154.t1 [Chlamydomonas eustigma]
MNLTILTWRDDFVTVHVDASAHIEDLKAILEAETSLPKHQQTLVFGTRILADGMTLGSCGINDGDIIQLVPSNQQQQQRQEPRANDAAMELNADGSAKNPAALMSSLRSDPQKMLALESNSPFIAKAIKEEDISAFQQGLRMIKQVNAEKFAKEAELQKYMALAEADPFNPEVQKKIEELINQKNIEDNYDHAMEFSPEVFSQVIMLYVDMEVNGVPVKTFVDSGAQMTIMTQEFAEKCYLTRLIDKRFQGMAVGVGSSKIIGRIHQAPMRVAGQYITTSITVLEQKSGPQFIFGLDNLKRHQCCIDLKSNELVFGSCDAHLPFLPENEFPTDFREHIDKVSEADAKRNLETPSAGAASTSVPNVGRDAPPPAATTVPTPSAPLPGDMGGKLERLMALGFSKDQCEAALKMAGGNEEYAASVLFEQ